MGMVRRENARSDPAELHPVVWVQQDPSVSLAEIAVGADLAGSSFHVVVPVRKVEERVQQLVHDRFKEGVIEEIVAGTVLQRCFSHAEINHLMGPEVEGSGSRLYLADRLPDSRGPPQVGAAWDQQQYSRLAAGDLTIAISIKLLPVHTRRRHYRLHELGM